MVKTRSGFDTKLHSWTKEKPSKQERKTMPLKCFLDPENRKYPICPSHSSEITRTGLIAAIKRSRMQHNLPIMKKAQKMLANR